MAIVQVSRITQRKGLEEDLPQPLAGAELGWAIDQRRLYIGNGTLAEGAPVVGNTEVLTEFSDILGYSTAYTYQGQAAGYTVQTGVTSSTPVSQSLQSRLDSYAIVTDFGATGNGITDDTAAINRALNQLYCVQSNPQIRRSLFFPAGRYIVSNTLLVPPYATLYGEGSLGSIIQFTVQIWAANTAYATGVLVVNLGSYYRSKVDIPATGIAVTDSNYWDSATLPAYVLRTADSRQQVGGDIGIGGAVTPTNVTINNMSIQTTTFASGGGHDVCLIEQASQISFSDVSFVGALTTSELTASAEELAGVRFSSTAGLPCENITFDTCHFSGMTYGINTDVLTKGVSVSSCLFETLYQGIVLGDATPVLGGPSGFRVMHNTFDLIYNEGVIIDNCSLNATGYNTFYNVGNHFSPTPVSSGTSTPIISINADNNVSVGDMFQRTDAQAAATNPRIYLYNATTSVIPSSVAMTNSQQLRLGAYTRESGVQNTIEDGFSQQTLFTVNTTTNIGDGGYQAFRMEYTMYRTTSTDRAVRTGVLTVVSSDVGDSAGATPLTFVDDYTENGLVDVTLLVTEAGGTITVAYTANATGFDGTIWYSLTHLA